MNFHHPPGGLSPTSGLFAFQPHTTPETFKEALGDEIERMIAMLDALDGDTDVEPDADFEPDFDGEDGGDDEPSFGSLGGTGDGLHHHAKPQAWWAHGDRTDREPNGDERDCDLAGATSDLEHDSADEEPSLGSLCGTAAAKEDQRTWGGGTSDDRELDYADDEDGGDAEPSGFKPRRRLPAIVAPSCGASLPDNMPLRGSVRIDDPHHPEAFALCLEGDCLSPTVNSGDVAIVEPVLPRPGDLAVFWFKAGGKPSIKYLVTPLDYCFPHNPKREIVLEILVRMLNPPKQLAVTADRIERIWRVARIVSEADVVRV